MQLGHWAKVGKIKSVMLRALVKLTIIQMKQTQTHSVLPCLGLPENDGRN